MYTHSAGDDGELIIDVLVLRLEFEHLKERCRARLHFSWLSHWRLSHSQRLH